ncbi:type 4a pilus biogenesis protein PilO [Vibrio sp. SM6]|uniref:Type 4a pilus biogenesis protein PilO n=1 Tax=Vibrio agarilyticus TaxID=2726741 RepID=A0A7X8TTL1_9VIBR|nr:type 4a pilus biogenesis protein PilO [Vibrio agarilyticus]NLS14594.1 type 4a pilus biogenesis protein PilO [Vibrio agarilyticus]
MKQRWQQWCDAFIGLSVRERGLIALLGATAIAMSGFILMIEAQWQQGQQLRSQQAQNEQQQRRILAELEIGRAQLQRDPNRSLNQQLDGLLKQSEQLSQDLLAQTDKFVSPAEMAALLERVLSDNQGVNLLSITSLKAQPLQSDGLGQGNYYLHPVRLELSGRYFAIAEYLKTLENLPVRYFWRHFDYQLQQYPNAKVTLEVYTLGTREEFISG